MKIATFNINNIRKRLPNLLDWMRETGPDVVCLQELKTTDAEFPVEAIREAGFRPKVEDRCTAGPRWRAKVIGTSSI
jgi:exonuclease III